MRLQDKFGSSLLGLVRSGGLNRPNLYLVRYLIDAFVLERKQLTKIAAMSFSTDN